MSKTSTYIPPKVWQWDNQDGGRFTNINRPIAGATHIAYAADREVVGFQLNSSADNTMLDALPGS